jgi:hypothetical protein
MKPLNYVRNNWIAPVVDLKYPFFLISSEMLNTEIISCKEDRFEAIVFHHFLPFPDVHDA